MPDFVEQSAALGNAVWMRRDRELGLSREALAAKLGWVRGDVDHRSRTGWSPKTIVRIERAERGLRSESEYNLLAQSLDLTPGQLGGRISQASVLPRSGESDGIADAIAQVDDPEQRAALARILDDLAGLARSLGGQPPGSGAG